MSLKFSISCVGMVGMLLVVAGCAPGPPEVVKETVVVENTVVVKETVVAQPTFDITGPKYGGTLVFARPGCVDDVLDEDKSNDTAARELGRHVLETLTIVDPATGEIHPGLATSWEVSEDGLEIIFHLREGVKFHDGTPFNAEAVKYNFDRTMKLPPKVAWQFMGGDKFKECQVIDENTVKVVFNQPYAGFLAMLSDGALSIDSPMAIEKYGEEYGVKYLVGTGPFKFVEWVPDDHLTLERNPDYAWAPEFFKHQGPPYLEQYICREMPEPSALAAAVEIGEADLGRITEAEVVNFMGMTGFKVMLIPKAGTTRFFMMNTETSPTDEFAVRNAIQYAIDKQAIIDTPAFGGIGKVGVAALPSNMVPGGVDEFAQLTPPYDPEEAKEILEGAGWIDADEDGVREKNGEPLRVVFVVPSWDLLLVEPAEKMLRDVGFEVELVVVDFNAWWERATDGDFNLTTMSDSGYEGPTLLWNFYKSDAPYAFTRLKDEELDMHLDAGLTTMDPKERWEHVRAALRILIEKAVSVDVIELMYPFVMKDTVQDPFFTEIGVPYVYDTWIMK